MNTPVYVVGGLLALFAVSKLRRGARPASAATSSAFEETFYQPPASSRSSFPSSSSTSSSSSSSSSGTGGVDLSAVQSRLNLIRVGLRGGLSAAAMADVPWPILRVDRSWGPRTASALASLGRRWVGANQSVPANLLTRMGVFKQPSTVADVRAIEAWLGQVQGRMEGRFLTQLRAGAPTEPVIVPPMANLDSLTQEMERQGYIYRPDR